jgi:hypothetical protein
VLHDEEPVVGRRREQPVDLMRELAAGLAHSISKTLEPPLRAETVGLGVRIYVGGEVIEIDVGYPWDLAEPIASNIEGVAEIVLSQAQAELAEATTEPWPARMTAAPVNARGLPEVEAKLVDDLLELRFHFGSMVIELAPIKVRLVR